MVAEQSWGVQLWDQTSNLLKYQESGIVLHEKLQKFILEIARLQAESFLAQKRVCEKALINIKKVVGLETTYGQGYNAFIHAVAKLIDTENLLPVSFNLQANGEAKHSIDEEKKGLKQWKQDRDRFQNEAKSQAKIIDDEIKRFHEKYRDVLRSKEEYYRVDGDKTCSKLDVERALNVYTQKHNEFKRARSDYVAALDQFNFHRRYHYSTTLKKWGETGQTLETYRITKTQEMISVLVERLRVMVDRLLSVCSDLEVAVATMDVEKDSAALIERLRTGNEPPGDVPVIHLDISDPPITSNHSCPDNGGSSYRSGVTETSENKIYYASIPVSPGVTANGSPFAGADPIVEPAEAQRLSTGPVTPYPSLSRSARRFSMSSMGLGSSPNTGCHSSFLWKVFSRRSKSRETDRRPDAMAHNNRRSRSQSRSESPTKRVEIVHLDHDRTKGPMGPVSDASDTEMEDEGTGDQPEQAPPLQPRSAPLFRTSESTHEMAQTELSRSLSTPSSNGNGAHMPKSRPRPPGVSSPKPQSPKPLINGSLMNVPASRTNFSRGSIVGTVPGSQTIHHMAQAGTNSRQTIHQPKRHHGGNHHARKSNSEMKLAHRSSMSDLIAVGTCKALYDFESSKYGETFLSFTSGDQMKVISSSTRWQGDVDADGWIYAETIPSSDDTQALSRRGFIPASFVEITLFPEPLPLSPPRRHEAEELASHRRDPTNVRSENAYLALGQATEL